MDDHDPHARDDAVAVDGEVAHAKHGATVLVNGQSFHLGDRTPTGRQVRQAGGLAPASDFVLVLMVEGSTRSVGLDETVDLRELDEPRFRAFESDRIFEFTFDEKGFEWGVGAIDEAELRSIAGLAEDREIVLENDGSVIPDGGTVQLGGRGVEHLVSRPRPQKTFTIVVNGRQRTVTGPRISFESVVALAFPNPPAGEGVQFTVQYARGDGDKPSGTLIEGQSLKLREGMEFDVTSTNRS